MTVFRLMLKLLTLPPWAKVYPYEGEAFGLRVERGDSSTFIHFEDEHDNGDDE